MRVETELGLSQRSDHRDPSWGLNPRALFWARPLQQPGQQGGGEEGNRLSEGLGSCECGIWLSERYPPFSAPKIPHPTGGGQRMKIVCLMV
jgi:hypothetical protein